MVVHHEECFPLQGRIGSVAVVFAIDFESAQVDPFLFASAVRCLADLAHPLANGVIDVIGSFALMLQAIFVAGVHRLALGHL